MKGKKWMEMMDNKKRKTVQKFMKKLIVKKNKGKKRQQNVTIQ